jgi:uncharacterized protein YdbL (DUF1318 family)
MALSQAQAFKIGFLMKCAEQGLTIEETHERVKEAITKLKMQKNANMITDPLKFIGSKTWDAGKVLGSLGLAGAVGLPIVGGAGAGYLAAKATQSDGTGLVEDAKQDEIVGEYERLAEEARRRARIKQIQESTGRRIVALTPSAQTVE